MTRQEIFDFIKTQFSEYHWKSANKYLYYGQTFSRYGSYQDFLKHQEKVLNEKSDEELDVLIEIYNNLTSIKIMDTTCMYSETTKGYIFDKDGSLIIFS